MYDIIMPAARLNDCRSICDEYRRFSHPKSRTLDQQFIELFDVSKVHIDKRHRPEWL
jgi:tyrosine-protein phosphatase SIW14